MDETLRLSPRVLLTRGDRIKLSLGPYYQCKSGRKVPVGPRGSVLFLGSVSDPAGSEVIYVQKEGHAETVTLKYGDGVGTASGVVHRPYKITKERLRC